MKFKKLVSLSASLVMCASMITGCSSKSENEVSSKTSDISVGIVLGEGSVNDESFNQATWEGLKQAEDDIASGRFYTFEEAAKMIHKDVFGEELPEEYYKYLIENFFRQFPCLHCLLCYLMIQ